MPEPPKWSCPFVWPIARFEPRAVFTVATDADPLTPRQEIVAAYEDGDLTLHEALAGFLSARRMDDDPWIHGWDPEGPGE